MRVVETITAVRATRPAYRTLGLVPTMGFLHAGHMSLVARAKADFGAVAVSIFVNPTQFGPDDDLDRYPRDLPRDLALLETAGADLVFIPTATELYPSDFATCIEVGAVAEPLEGAARPGHFAGVATIVAKLFNIFEPTGAYFGQKDAQQAVVIRAMARDLNLPVQVVIAPTVREADGLALSSRNSYLTPTERAIAPMLYRALDQVRARFDAGERNAETLRSLMAAVVGVEPTIKVEYLSVAHPDTLRELESVESGALVSLAARLGRTRLIDNILIGRTD